MQLFFFGALILIFGLFECRTEPISHLKLPPWWNPTKLGKNEKLKRLKNQVTTNPVGGEKENPADWQRSHLSTRPELCRQRGMKALFFLFFLFLNIYALIIHDELHRCQTATDPPWRPNRAEQRRGEEGKQGLLNLEPVQRCTFCPPVAPLCCHGDGSFHFLFISVFIYLYRYFCCLRDSKSRLCVQTEEKCLESHRFRFFKY